MTMLRERGAPGPGYDLIGMRGLVWFGSLLTLSLVLDGAFACVTPFAAFATAAILTMRRGEALALMALVWLGNQAVGFTFLDYPWTLETVLWGGAIGAAALGATGIGGYAASKLVGVARPLTVALTFITAFVVYEMVLVAATFTLGADPASFGREVMAGVLLLDAATAVGLYAVLELLKGMGVARVRNTALAPAA